MPRVSEQHTEARKRQIIDAAYRCFARRGFHQTTMREIYEEAGLSPGAVYHYFDSKDAIILASFGFDYNRSGDILNAARQSDDPAVAMQELLDFFLHGLKDAAELGAGRVNVQGWGEALINPKFGEALVEWLHSYVDALAHLAARAQEAGQLDEALDPASVGRLLLSVYYGLELQLALDPQVDVEQYIAAAKSLFRSATRMG